MRTALCLSLLFLITLPAIAGDVRTINANCEQAIVKAEVLAAKRKWWPDRPDPKAPVLSIRTHSNFAKGYLVPLGLGIVWSHEKVGELAFEDQGESCRVTSNGHPADVVVSDLAKAEFPAPALARQTDAKESTQTPAGKERTQITAQKCPQGTHWGDNSNGEPICVWSH
jgi:hypothetical protein